MVPHDPKRITGNRRNRRQMVSGPGSWVVLVALLAIGLIVVFAVAWFAPAMFVSHDIPSGKKIPSVVDEIKARNAVRTTLLQGIAGVFLLASAVVAWRQMTATAAQASRAQESATKEIQLATSSTRREHMSRALAELGDASPDARVGGVFSLEQAMDELDPIDAVGGNAALLKERSFREDAIYILASFVRTRSQPANPQDKLPRSALHSGADPKHQRDDFEDIDLRVRAPDAQAAALVIGRRPKFSDADYEKIAANQRMEEDESGFEPELKSWLKRVEVSLHRAYLNNAALSDLNLTLVRFDDAVLTYASLRRADLRCSRLIRADLRRAFLRNADLRWTNLEAADLTGARMIRANFAGAKLVKANFAGARVEGAKFKDALDVDKVKCWDGARADKATTWPNERAPQGVVVVDAALDSP